MPFILRIIDEVRKSATGEDGGADRPENFLLFRRILLRIGPEIDFLEPQDNRHAVVDLLDEGVAIGGEDGAGFDDQMIIGRVAPGHSR